MLVLDPAHALGAFLRAHRERLPPPGSSRMRRRTPGLRREELAEAAGVSLTWVTWLEQGRRVSASPAALARLAVALRLTAAERGYLFELAGKHDPEAPPAELEALPEAILALPGQLRAPAYLLDPTWNALSWNPAAEALFAGWLRPGEERNLLRFVFLHAGARRLIVDWEARAARLAAEFRTDYSLRPLDPAMQALLEELNGRSPLFARLWSRQAVLQREGGEREFLHPEQGPRRYVQSTLLVAAHTAYKLICLQPIDGGEG